MDSSIIILKITPTYNNFWYKIHTSAGIVQIHIDSLTLYKIEKGKSISQEQFHHLYILFLIGKIKEKTLRKLAVKARSLKELKQSIKESIYKLTKEENKTINTQEYDEIEKQTLNFLNKHNYIDDYKYAELLINKLSSGRKPKGKNYIYSYLHTKGIDSEAINHLLKTIEENDSESELLKAQMLIKKFASRKKFLTADHEKKKSIGLRYLATQGFSFDICLQALKDYL